VENTYRYRGYRYDSETGLYYLQSRYYNPVNGEDEDGHWWGFLVEAAEAAVFAIPEEVAAVGIGVVAVGGYLAARAAARAVSSEISDMYDNYKFGRQRGVKTNQDTPIGRENRKK
jgi:uncharacterized protein RhaS with RHS repeats